MFKSFLTTGNLLLENMKGEETWKRVSEPLIARLKAQTEPGYQGHVDMHPIAWGLRHDPERDPESKDRFEDAKREFLETVSGLAPVGHAKTYGPVIARIFAHGNHQFGEDNEGIRRAVEDWHGLRSAGVFQPHANSEDKILKNANNPAAIKSLDQVNEILSHPVVQARRQQEATNLQLSNDYVVLHRGKDEHGNDVTAYAPKTIQALHNLYGLGGDSGLKAQFGGAHGVGWCTVEPRYYKNYVAINSENAGSPLIVFKRDKDKHPFAQMHAITGQLHGRLPTSGEDTPIHEQQARMTNSSIDPTRFDIYMPGFGAKKILDDTRKAREARIAGYAQQLEDMREIARSTDEELAGRWAVHENPDYRVAAVREAGNRRLEGIIQNAANDPHPEVVCTAASLTSDPALHRRFSRANAPSDQKIAVAGNFHLNPENAKNLLKNSQMPSVSNAADAWNERWDDLSEERKGLVGDALPIAKKLSNRYVPYSETRGMNSVAVSRMQHWFRRNPIHYQAALSHVSDHFMDNASPHTVGPDQGPRSVEELANHGDTTPLAAHMTPVMQTLVTHSLDNSVLRRFELLPPVPGRHPDDTSEILAQRGFRTGHFLDHPNPKVRAAAVVGTLRVDFGREHRGHPAELDGGNVNNYYVNNKADMYRSQLVNMAKNEREIEPLSKLVHVTYGGYGKKTERMPHVKAALAARLAPGNEHGINASEQEVSNLASSLIKTHPKDVDLGRTFAIHPSPAVRGAVASNQAHFDEELHRHFINDEDSNVREHAFATAIKQKRWDIAHHMVRNHLTSYPEQAHRKQEYRDYVRDLGVQEGVSFAQRNYIKQKLLENVTIL